MPNHILQTSLFENVDSHKCDGMTPYGNLVTGNNYNKKRGPFLLDILPYGVFLKTNASSFVVRNVCIVNFTYGFDLFNFLVSRSPPCPQRTVATDSDGQKKDRA